MINVKELQIGNIVLLSKNNLLCTVKEITQSKLTVSTPDGDICNSVNDFEPMPINEMILSEVGFTKYGFTGDYDIFNDHYIITYKISENISILDSGADRDGEIYLKIKDTHILQNFLSILAKA